MNTKELKPPKNTYDGFVIQELKDELLVYNTRTNRAFALNHTAAVIWQNCDGEKTVHDLALDIAKETGLEPNDELVMLSLDRLNKDGLLDLSEWPALAEMRMERRELIKKAAIAAFALPVIASLTAPLAIHAQSGVPPECAACLTKAHEADLCPTVCDATILGDCHDNSGCGIGQVIAQETCAACFARFIPGPSATTFSWHGTQYKP